MKKTLILCGVMLFTLFVFNFEANAQTKKIMKGLVTLEAIAFAKPVRPENAKDTKGKVGIIVTIDENGDVIDAKAVSGNKLLREASVKAAKESRFKPYEIKGNAIKASGLVYFNFR
jgi:periplasmic protein TonB